MEPSPLPTPPQPPAVVRVQSVEQQNSSSGGAAAGTESHSAAPSAAALSHDTVERDGSSGTVTGGGRVTRNDVMRALEAKIEMTQKNRAVIVGLLDELFDKPATLRLLTSTTASHIVSTVLHEEWSLVETLEALRGVIAMKLHSQERLLPHDEAAGLQEIYSALGAAKAKRHVSNALSRHRVLECEARVMAGDFGELGVIHELPRAGLIEGSVEQAIFNRIAENWHHKLHGALRGTVKHPERFIRQIDCIVNPLLVNRFKDKQAEYSATYGPEGAKATLAFHGIRKNPARKMHAIVREGM
jgi:hypothetical protein